MAKLVNSHFEKGYAHSVSGKVKEDVSGRCAFELSTGDLFRIGIKNGSLNEFPEERSLLTLRVSDKEYIESMLRAMYLLFKYINTDR